MAGFAALTRRPYVNHFLDLMEGPAMRANAC